jgi:hypothetical protein
LFAKKLFRFIGLLKTNKLFKTPLGRFGGPFYWAAVQLKPPCLSHRHVSTHRQFPGAALTEMVKSS